MDDWIGEPFSPPDHDRGLDAMVERWLRTFGPGTEVDIKWWLGHTLTGVRGSLTRLDAVEVSLDGATGWILPDDLDPSPEVEPWGALLPGLDPTTMGWSERDWYLGPHKGQVFDTNGNAGPTAWWNGRIVGGWRQDDEGVVEVQLLEDVGSDAMASLAAMAERLTGWLDGVRVLPRFPSPLFKADR
jgi:hypothetical protein